MLQRELISFHVVWFLGKGDKGKRDTVQLENGTTIQYMSFSEDYPDYLKAADLFISKPGGVSMAEALHWKIPTGILSPLPGQEKINQKVLNQYDHITLLDKNVSLADIFNNLEIDQRIREKKTEEKARVRIVDRMVEHICKTTPTVKERSFIPSFLRRQLS
ncbi:UDP-N-acetylglucosamine:LPS N-acetylglucosamine transferase [Evansella vedderi]|uniref:UDP-N-acetylglucosamine:LPS N-acetylglucosamine transferase n=1 Tax=Evansella vedderi TaxID=38282 RepID=A0ABT9ZRS4_9BACI|nr:glycosyltransferase [Evansella vedderi]MDQ0253909.1 UDP-N-acetylglucosamine:LPS N-acetylglucosamine transferase [Evansella vedderi]